MEKDLGVFYDNPNYIESFVVWTHNPAIKTMITPNTYVRRCYIQLTNDCDLNCSFLQIMAIMSTDAQDVKKWKQ